MKSKIAREQANGPADIFVRMSPVPIDSDQAQQQRQGEQAEGDQEPGPCETAQSTYQGRRPVRASTNRSPTRPATVKLCQSLAAKSTGSSSISPRPAFNQRRATQYS